MNWTLIPLHPASHAFAQHQADWQSAWEGSLRLSFMRREFIEPLLQEFADEPLTLALCEVDGKCRAAALLKSAGFGRYATWQPSQLPLGAWLSPAGQDVAPFANRLLQKLGVFALNLGITQLDPLNQPRPAAGACMSTLDYIETAWVTVQGGFDDYFAARSKNMRQNIRKAQNRMATEGQVGRMEVICDAAQMAAQVADYGALETRSWKSALGTAIAPDNAQGRFYTRMLENFANLGQARVYRYLIDDQLAAIDLCVEQDDNLVILKTTYDDAFKALSPAFLLHLDMFQAIWSDNKTRRIEFYGKKMEWHTRWTEDARVLYHLNVDRFSWLAALRRQPATNASAANDTTPA